MKLTYITKNIRTEFQAESLVRLRLDPSFAKKLEAVTSTLHHQVLDQIKDYLAGESKSFSTKLSLNGTEFQQLVWKELLRIPYGETRTYAQLAEKIGRPGAVRAVGSACGANPVPIIVPCHRVIRSDGSLGGYALGLELKRQLLELEAERQGR